MTTYGIGPQYVLGIAGISTITPSSSLPPTTVIRRLAQTQFGRNELSSKNLGGNRRSINLERESDTDRGNKGMENNIHEHAASFNVFNKFVGFGIDSSVILNLGEVFIFGSPFGGCLNFMNTPENGEGRDEFRVDFFV